MTNPADSLEELGLTPASRAWDRGARGARTSGAHSIGLGGIGARMARELNPNASKEPSELKPITASQPEKRLQPIALIGYRANLSRR
jgi:hypothetical protein